MNRFCCKLAQVVHVARACNDHLRGQKVKGQWRKARFGDMAEASFSVCDDCKLIGQPLITSGLVESSADVTRWQWRSAVPDRELQCCTGTNTCPHPRPSRTCHPHPHPIFTTIFNIVPIPVPSPQQSFPSAIVPADDCSHASPQNHHHVSNKTENWESENTST